MFTVDSSLASGHPVAVTYDGCSMRVVLVCGDACSDDGCTGGAVDARTFEDGLSERAWFALREEVAEARADNREAHQ